MKNEAKNAKNETKTYVKTVVFTQSGSLEPVVATMEGPVEDLVGILAKAAGDAAKAGWRGLESELPAQYLAKYGASMRRAGVSYVEDALVGQDESPIRICTCRDCASYEEGSCYRYGGLVDGFSTDCDRLHGTGGESLAYDGYVFGGTIFETDLDAVEAAEYVLRSGEPLLEGLKKEILGRFADEGVAAPESDLWELAADLG